VSASLEAKVAGLEARLHLIEEERSVLKTLHQYAHAIDYGLEASWLDCFTEDGAFDLHIRQDGAVKGAARGYGIAHDKGVRFAGQAMLRRFIENHTRAPGKWHKHFMVEPVVSLAADGEHATVHSYFARLDQDDATRFIHAFGRYIDSLVRCPDGRWRFAERIAEIESM
jgi:hypothetical protein